MSIQNIEKEYYKCAINTTHSEYGWEPTSYGRCKPLPNV